jgi:hypothetical protein
MANKKKQEKKPDGRVVVITKYQVKCLYCERIFTEDSEKFVLDVARVHETTCTYNPKNKACNTCKYKISDLTQYNRCSLTGRYLIIDRELCESWKKK